MSSELQFTGERFVPGVPGAIAHEHRHRYAFAQRFVSGRRVADIACGEGYGSALMAQTASSVVGVDIDAATVGHATATYARDNLSFVTGSATALPLPDASVDVLVSFETIEHVPAPAQVQMLREFARVLQPDGVLVISSPNRPEYSEKPGFQNPFHLHELDRDELKALLDAHFTAQHWFRQRRYLGSAVWAEAGGDGHEAFVADDHSVAMAQPPEATYFVVVAARRAQALPRGPALSLLGDADEREWQRLDDQAREVLRLDALLKERDAALDAQSAHIAHLEELVAYRERLVEQRDADLAARTQELRAANEDLAACRAERGSLEAERQRLERAIAAQERIIAYRQSARWWVQLPWVRVRNVLQRLG